jgi:hypothetical protein
MVRKIGLLNSTQFFKLHIIFYCLLKIIILKFNKVKKIFFVPVFILPLLLVAQLNSKVKPKLLADTNIAYVGILNKFICGKGIKQVKLLKTSNAKAKFSKGILEISTTSYNPFNIVIYYRKKQKTVYFISKRVEL